jgi:hypothetical protein
MAEFYIVSKLSGYAIAAESGEKGAKLILKSIDPRSDYQKWALKDGYLQHLNSDLVVDITGISKNAGTALIMWDRHGRDNQQFFWKQNSLYSKLREFVIDIPGESTLEDEALIMYDVLNQLNQLWMIVPVREVTDDFAKTLNTTFTIPRGLSYSDLFIHIEITNRSKFSLCDPKTYIEEGKFGEIPFWVDKSSSLQKTIDVKRIFAFSHSSQMCGILSFTIFNDGQKDPRIAFYFSLETSLLWGNKNRFNVHFLKEGVGVNQALSDKLAIDSLTPGDGIQTFVDGKNKASARITKCNKCFMEIVFE